MQQFMGIEPVFWTGVVEDRNDPMKLGRVRVRIAGLHSPKLVENDATGEGIPVKSLPWAYPGMPITGAGMNGVGESPTGPVEGTWVCGISRDGRPCQNLVYLYVLPGIPQEAPKNEGFNDTEETIKAADRPFPLGKAGEKFPRADFLKEPDTNRLARNEKIDQTVIQNKRDNEDKGVPKANGGSWNEKGTAYDAVYPFNKVHETESGHIIERDDTPGSERTHDYHRSGTFREVHPDGTTVEKIVKDKYEIIHGDDFVHIKGNVTVTIDGNAHLYVKGNVEEQVDGNVHTVIKGNLTAKISGNTSVDTGGTMVLKSGGTMDLTAGGNMTLKAPKIDLN